MKNLVLVGMLFLLWLSSMLFYFPLPLVVVLFAALVSCSSVALWLALMKRWTGRSSIVKTDAKA